MRNIGVKAGVLLLVVFFWMRPNCVAAPGDVLWASVDTNGWSLSVGIEGMDTNGVSAFGLGANFTPYGQEYVKVDVTSMGFDDNGNSITTHRALVATRDLRLPFPDQAFKDRKIQDGVLINRLVLSDYIYAKDSNVVVTISAGQYTAAGTQSAAATLQATNSSPLQYPKPIANWTWPGWERVSGPNFTLRAVGFNQYAEQFRPVRLMRFISRDGHGHVLTNDLNQMTIDRNLGDAKPFGEYIATVSTDPLMSGDLITNTFQAFPWIGDTPIDSGDGTNLQPTPLYSSLYMLNDKDGAYGSTVAVVSNSGDDDSGEAVDSSRFDASIPPKPFLTIGRAANAIAATNNLVHGRNDLGGGVIYLRTGNYFWLGNNHQAYGDTPQCFVEVTTFPGDSIANLVGGNSQNTTLSGKVKVSNIRVASDTADTFTGDTYFWMDRCIMDSPAKNPFYNLRIWYTTRSEILQLFQGFQPYVGDNTAPALIRGNRLDLAGGLCIAYNVCGNTFPHALQGGALRTDVSGKSFPYPDGGIVYNNEFMKFSADIGVLYECYYDGMTNGLAFVQNMMECATNGSYQFVAISGFSAVNSPLDNILFWHNTAVGRRCDLAFNRGGTESAERLFWSLKNNLFDKISMEGDVANPGSSARTGNWSELFGVGFSGNINGLIAGVAGQENDSPEFLGISSIQSTSGNNPQDFFKFVDNEAYNGIQNQPGGGDYHPGPNSPAFAIKGEALLPFDLNGEARVSSVIPGAFGPAQVKIQAGVVSSGTLEFNITAASNTAVLERSIDFQSWTPVATNTLSASPWKVDADISGASAFFRISQP